MLMTYRVKRWTFTRFDSRLSVGICPFCLVNRVLCFQCQTQQGSVCPNRIHAATDKHCQFFEVTTFPVFNQFCIFFLTPVFWSHSRMSFDIRNASFGRYNKRVCCRCDFPLFVLCSLVHRDKVIVPSCHSRSVKINPTRQSVQSRQVAQYSRVPPARFQRRVFRQSRCHR